MSTSQVQVLSLNSVDYIIKNRPLQLEVKIQIKQKGRPTPDLSISFTSSSRNRSYSRQFNRNIYDKYDWICGCPVGNKLYCFVCILIDKDTSVWVKGGVNDLKHLHDKAKKHESSVSHLNSCVDYSVLGRTDIRESLSRVYLINKQKHNDTVKKNRHILQRLIMCIKFCGAFELALRGHDESAFSSNPGVYLGLVNFAAELDSSLAIHLKEATTFKGTSKSIQNDLLDAMFAVYQSEVSEQIKSAKFLAIEADETTDSSNQQQMVVVFRYVFNSEICERFWCFIKPDGYTADMLSSVLLKELKALNIPPEKLIAQSYDGAAVMSGRNNSVQVIIRNTFPNAFYIHCYAHQFNLVMERAARCNTKVKVFFANLQAFSSFFSRSPKRTAILDEVSKRRLPRTCPTRWNFKSRTVNTLYENKDSFKECLEKIIEVERDSITIHEANGLLNNLTDEEFLYWLTFFHLIMPHVEIFFNQAQTRGADSFFIQKAVGTFEQHVLKIRMCSETIISHEKEPGDSRRTLRTQKEANRSVAAKEVCDNILTQIRDRFDFKNHFCAAKLFDSENFREYEQNFPQNYFDVTISSYPMLSSSKLKTELSCIYSREDMRSNEGILSLFTFISENNLKNVFSESCKLLDIICTTPMSTSECERCFSTLKRIKSFLRNTMSEDRLNALAALSIEKAFIQNIPDFDNKVTEVFANQKHRRMEFFYK